MPRPPAWLRVLNAVERPLLAAGWAPPAHRLLCVSGRRSRLERCTPVVVVTLAGARYLVAGTRRSGWVANVRASGTARLRRGGAEEHVRLVEVAHADAPPVLREFLRQVRGGRRFLTFGRSATDAELATAAARDHPVFRLEG